MSTLKTHNLQSPDASSVNIALAPNAGMIVAGISTFSNDVKFEGASYDVLWDKSDNQLEFGDNAKLSFGTSSDLQIFHDSNNSVIKNNTNILLLQTDYFQVKSADNVEHLIGADKDGSVRLNYNGNVKVETTNTGAVVTGILTATSFKGDGSQLSNLPASAPVGGSSSNKVFFENDKVVSVNYQITSTKNAMTAGPVTINSGIGVTVPSGCAWTIV